MESVFFLCIFCVFCMVSIQSVRRLSTMASSDLNFFKSNKLFAVVGASEGNKTFLTHSLAYSLTHREDRDKFGNKVLRCYKQHGYKVIPINKKSKMIEEISAIPDLTTLLTSTNVSAGSIGVLI